MFLNQPARSLAFLSSALLAALIAAVPSQAPLAQTAAAQSVPAPPPIRVFTREIALDINVTNADGKPVHGLSQTDFTILEDHRPVIVRSFREHSGTDLAPAPGAGAQTTLAPNTFTNEAPPEGPMPLTVLLVDTLDTPMANQILLDKQLGNFASRLPQGARVSVFFISGSGQLSMLQGFTSDPEQIRRAAKSIKTQIPPLEDGGQDPNNTDATSSSRSNTPSLLGPDVDPNIECIKTANRASYTYTALGQIARYLSGMRGRKNLIWFTGGYPFGLRDKQGVACFDARDDVNSSDVLLEHAHVAVYPIDPRALDISARFPATSRLGQLSVFEHNMMEDVAEQTGGRAFYNTNDLAGAAINALSSGLDYYAITYTSPDSNWDTRRRNISVKVGNPGLNLVYKNSYNAIPPGATKTFNGRPIERATPVQTAMMRGAPEPSEILFQVNVASAGTSPTAAPGNTPDPKLLKPPYRALTLTYTVDISNMEFAPQPDGAYHGAFEYAVDVYGHDGKLLNFSILAAKPALPPNVYESMRNSGLKLRQTVDVPASGDTTLRIGLHDLPSGHVGAVEVPTSSLAP